MTPEERLAELARKATPGPWIKYRLPALALWRIKRSGDTDDEIARDLLSVDAAYIAACDPSTILALIEEKRRLREALEKIVEVGTHTENRRIGDAYSADGWDRYTIESEEAEIARAALAEPVKSEEAT